MIKKKVERTEGELFTTRREIFENDGTVSIDEMFEVLEAMGGARETRRFLNDHRKWAEGTVRAAANPELRRKSGPGIGKRRNRKEDDKWWGELSKRADDVLRRISELEREIERGDLHDTLHAGMKLQRAIIETDLFYKEAEIRAREARGLRASRKTGGDSTGAKTAKSAAKRKAYVRRRSPDYDGYSPGERARGLAGDTERRLGVKVKPSTIRSYISSKKKTQA